MQRELIINVNPTEVSIALCEDKVLVELNKEQCETGFAVGDIYVGKVRKIMPGLNAAFINIGHEKDAFIHYLDLGANYSSLKRVVDSRIKQKRPVNVEGMKLEPHLEKATLLWTVQGQLYWLNWQRKKFPTGKMSFLCGLWSMKAPVSTDGTEWFRM